MAQSLIGMAPEQLGIAERFENAGKWVALELYEPPVPEDTAGKVEIGFRLKRIRAIGNSALECVRQLRQAGENPQDFEYTQLTPPY